MAYDALLGDWPVPRLPGVVEVRTRAEGRRTSLVVGKASVLTSGIVPSGGPAAPCMLDAESAMDRDALRDEKRELWDCCDSVRGTDDELLCMDARRSSKSAEYARNR